MGSTSTLPALLCLILMTSPVKAPGLALRRRRRRRRRMSW
jgi:hypothetical protein